MCLNFWNDSWKEFYVSGELRTSIKLKITVWKKKVIYWPKFNNFILEFILFSLSFHSLLRQFREKYRMKYGRGQCSEDEDINQIIK